MKKIQVVIIGLFLVNACFSQEKSIYTEIMDSLFTSIHNLVIDDIVKSEIKTLSEGDSINIQSSLSIVFDQEHSFVLYGSYEDDASFLKLKRKKQKKIADMIICFQTYVEENKQLPFDIFEHFEFSGIIFHNDSQIKAKYKIKPEVDELKIIDKTIDN